MNEPSSIKDIQAEQVVLQKAFIKDKVAYYKAQERLNASKVKLSEFNDHYGRIIQIINED